MYELIVCTVVAWSSSCQPQPPVFFPDVYFCEHGAQRVLAQRKDVRTLYCRKVSSF